MNHLLVAIKNESISKNQKSRKVEIRTITPEEKLDIF